MLFTTKQGEVIEIIIRSLKQTQTILHTEYTSHGIINTAHRYLALFNQLLQQGAEVPAVGVHRHVNTGVDSQFDSLFLILGNVVATIEIVDIGPVGHHHTIPVQVVLQPLGEVFIVSMQGESVVHGRVNHHRESTVTNHL